MNFHKNERTNINFLYPQDGETERVFKENLLPILLELKDVQKAYLVFIQDQSLHENRVALCIRALQTDEQEIIKRINNIFKRMFNVNQSLDIIFLSKEQEKKIKLFCAPFFNRDLKKTTKPDFYLSSTEGYNLEESRKCWCIKQLSYENRDDLILVEIDPGLLYRDSEKGDILLRQIVVAGRHLGYPIFPLKNWPIYVHVARTKKPINNILLRLEKEDVENIGWGELYSAK